MATAGFKGLGKLGLDVMPELVGNLAATAASEWADPMMIEWLNGWEKYANGITITASRNYAGQIGIASLLTNPLRGAVSGQLGITVDPKDQIDRSLLNKPDQRGNAPTFKSDGTKVEIHHVGQNPNGPFKEVHWEDHRGKGVDKINHPNKGGKSQIPRSKFKTVRKGYWKKVFDLWK